MNRVYPPGGRPAPPKPGTGRPYRRRGRPAIIGWTSPTPRTIAQAPAGHSLRAGARSPADEGTPMSTPTAAPPAAARDPWAVLETLLHKLNAATGTGPSVLATVEAVAQATGADAAFW